MRLLFASSNPHKVDEVRAILEPLGFDVIGLDSLANAPPEPIEDGDTFQANARIKAIYYAQRTGQLCLADDSGLEVDALGGAPGVHSARYAEAEKKTPGIISGGIISRGERDAANNAKLLRELKDIPFEQRTARFVCAMCLADPSGGGGGGGGGNILHETRGTFPGVITDSPAGINGFGYDPLLYLPDAGCTSAQLDPMQKNARSHRGQAARAMASWLRSHAQQLGAR